MAQELEHKIRHTNKKIFRDGKCLRGVTNQLVAPCLFFMISFLFSQALIAQSFLEYEFPKKGNIQGTLEKWESEKTIYILHEKFDYDTKAESTMLTMVNKGDLKVIKEIKLKINPPVVLPKHPSIEKRFVLYHTDGKYNYLIYDMGKKSSYVIYVNHHFENRYTNFLGNEHYFIDSYLVFQKFTKDFEPIGPSMPLMDPSIETTQFSAYLPYGYGGRVIFNNDSSRMAVFQSGAEKTKIILFDKSFNKIKEFDFIAMVKGVNTLRSIAFRNQEIGMLVSACGNPSLGVADYAGCPLTYMELNTTTGKVNYFTDDNFFSTNNLKAKFFRFLPPNCSTTFISMLNDRNLENRPPVANTFMSFEKKGTKISKIEGWTMEKEYRKNVQAGTFCFEDMYGNGRFNVLAMSNNNGYYLIAERDHDIDNCDASGRKDWHYFFVMTLDKNGKFISQKFFPINKPIKPQFAEACNIDYRVIKDNLIVLGNFSENYYRNGAKDDKKTIDRVPAILKIGPDLKASFLKIKDSKENYVYEILSCDDKELVGYYQETWAPWGQEKRHIFKFTY